MAFDLDIWPFVGITYAKSSDMQGILNDADEKQAYYLNIGNLKPAILLADTCYPMPWSKYSVE